MLKRNADLSVKIPQIWIDSHRSFHYFFWENPTWTCYSTSSLNLREFWVIFLIFKNKKLVGLSSFCPRFAGKCGRQSRDLAQSHQSYWSCSIHTWDDVAQKYSTNIFSYEYFLPYPGSNPIPFSISDIMLLQTELRHLQWYYLAFGFGYVVHFRKIILKNLLFWNYNWNVV